MLSIAIIGAGRLGTALTAALHSADLTVLGPYRRGELIDAPAGTAVILAVPEREIRALAASMPPDTLLGHCSASLPLDALAPHERFNCHPLMTLNAAGVGEAADAFRGAACAIDGSTERARSVASTIADALGMRPVHVPAPRRALYHAAASMASNYLVTLETAAESLAAHTGITRADLAPLVRASLEAWIAGGFHAAISGPVSRGDVAVVDRQRQAIAEVSPELLPLFDALTDRTRASM